MKLELKHWLKKEYKKGLQWTWVNLSNPWPKLWDEDNLIESKPKQIMKINSQSTQC
jgi:hypothetical protein